MDKPFYCNTALLYMNTNNGYTMLKNKIKISKIENIKLNDQLTYTIPCYKIENTSIQHFFHLEDIEFIHYDFTNNLENIYDLKITGLFNKKKNDWNKFIKPEELEEILTKEKFSTIDVKGLKFNPFLKKWKRSNDLSVNYIINSLKN